MNSDNNAVDREMLLAEFAALRAEILQRTSLQWNIFALQLTAAGVVFSFALSSPSHTAFLLILPVITYALTGRTFLGHWHGGSAVMGRQEGGSGGYPAPGRLGRSGFRVSP
jgi:hypothetical protein